MKRIGILLREKDGYKALNDELINYLESYDVSLLGIVADEKMDFNKIIDLINLCDGVILPGGTDESIVGIKICNYLYRIDKPTLGICLGMQNMAESANGLLAKLESNNHNCNNMYAHKVNIKRGTLLNDIIGISPINVNSRHNYHVLKTDLSICAYSNDFIIEAIEDKNKKFYLGVQWHPESLINDLNSKLIIDEFINKC